MRRLLSASGIVVTIVIVGIVGYALGQRSAPLAHGDDCPVTVADNPSTGHVSIPESASPKATKAPSASADVGDSDDKEGAVAATVRFLELTEDVMRMTPAEGAALQRSISTAGSADRLAAEVEATLTDLQVSIPEGVTVHIAPFGASTRQVGEGWEVAVWYAEVIVYGQELAVEQWRTATYTLVWEAGEWRMADLVSEYGPTPVRPASTVASTAGELIATTAGLSDAGWGS